MPSKPLGSSEPEIVRSKPGPRLKLVGSLGSAGAKSAFSSPRPELENPDSHFRADVVPELLSSVGRLSIDLSEINAHQFEELMLGIRPVEAANGSPSVPQGGTASRMVPDMLVVPQANIFIRDDSAVI